jgi:hypothetical protein
MPRSTDERAHQLRAWLEVLTSAVQLLLREAERRMG